MTELEALIRAIFSEYEDDRDVGIYAIFPSNRYLLPKVQSKLTKMDR
jgi:hypothetical protein